MALGIPVHEIVERSKNPLLGKRRSWKRVALGDIATIQNGFPFESSKFSKDRGVPLIRIRDVGDDTTNTSYVGEYSPEFVVRAGDLLVGMDGDFKCARWLGPDGLLNQRVCRLVLKSDSYRPKFLDYVLPGYLQAINDVTSSVTVKHLSSKTIAEIPLPLPPVDEQESIVAEIEKQFSRLDEAATNLKRTKVNLKRYKSSILKAMVDGTLFGNSPRYSNAVLGDVVSSMKNGLYKPASEYSSEGVACLRMYNIQDGRIVWQDIKRMRIGQQEFIDYGLQEGDLLVNRVNSRELVGKTALISSELEPSVFESKNIRLRLDQSLVLPAFINYQILFGSGRYFSGNAQQVVGMASISQRQIANFPIVLTDMSEQKRVVDEVNRRFSLIAETDSQTDTNLRRAERLRKAVLAKAFSHDYA